MSKTLKFLILFLFLVSALSTGANFVYANDEYNDCLADPTKVPGSMSAPGYNWNFVSNSGGNDTGTNYCIWTGGFCDGTKVGHTGVHDELFGPIGSQVWQYTEYVCAVDPSSGGTATVNVAETPVPGGSWSINPGNYTSSSNNISVGGSGTQLCITVNSTPTNYSLLRVDNSQNGQNSSCLTAFPNNTYTFTIVYQEAGGNPPPPPTGLSTGTGSCGTGTIYVSWNTSAGATSYQLHRNGSLIYNGSSTTFTDTGLTAGQSYTYTVYASNSYGQSGSSAGVLGTAPATCGGSGSVDLKGSSNGSTFTNGPIYVSYVSGILQNFWYNWTSTTTTSCSIGAPVNSGVGLSGTVGPLTSSHPHYPSVSGTTYTITCNVSGGGIAQDSVFAQRVPNAPSISANTSVSCGGAIVVNWTSSTGAISYKLYRDGGGTPIYTGSNTTYTDTVSPSTAHYYTVVATNAAGDSLQSASTGWVTSSASCSPASVTIDASPNPVTYGQSTTLTWSSQNVASCTSSASPSNSQWGNSDSKSTGGNQTITNMTVNTQFTISCTGVNGNASSNVSVDVVPAAPTNLTATAGACGSGTINLSWNASAGASSYSVHRSTTSGGPYMQVGSGITSTTYPDSSSLVPGTTYYYVVRAVNSSGSFGNSNQASAQAPSACAGPDLTAGNVTPTTADTGVPVTFTSTITNTGGVSTGSSFNNFFKLATGLNGSGSISTISVNSRAALSAGTSGPVSSSAYTFSTPSSTYSVQVCADQNQYASGTISESNESNNCSSWVNVVVSNSAPSFDYSLSNNGNVNVTKTAGDATGQSTITKTLVSGTTQSVDITATGMPAGVSVSYSNRTCSPTCQSTVTFTVPSTTSVGTYPITITGTPNNKTTGFNLVVSNPSSISTSCTVSPSPVQIGKPVTWSVNVVGGSGSFTYAWTGDDLGSPGPTTASFQKTYQSTGIKSANVVVTDTVSGSTTSCPAGVLGQTQVQVTVNPVFEEF